MRLSCGTGPKHDSISRSVKRLVIAVHCRVILTPTNSPSETINARLNITLSSTYTHTGTSSVARNMVSRVSPFTTRDQFSKYHSKMKSKKQNMYSSDIEISTTRRLAFDADGFLDTTLRSSSDTLFLSNQNGSTYSKCTSSLRKPSCIHLIVCQFTAMLFIRMKDYP